MEINSLLTTCNLPHILNFAAGIQNASNKRTDNIFVDSTRISSSSTSPIVNDLSDHDAKFLTINTVTEAN
jgi:hypothetical protein